MKNFDLSKLKSNPDKLLVKPELPIKKEDIVVEKPKKKSTKLGRPMIEKEPLNSPITINFTASERARIENRAGKISVSVYLRDLIKNLH